GQFVAIVGRSGCGKSTLLRLLLRLEPASGGQFWFGDRADDDGDRGAVRIMFQEPRLLPWASVLANVEVGLRDRGRGPDGRPRVLMFDEPLGALDALTRMSMQRLLEQLWLDQRFTAIMVTHDVAEAVMLADRVVVLDRGQVAMDQPIDLSRPRDRGSPEV